VWQELFVSLLPGDCTQNEVAYTYTKAEKSAKLLNLISLLTLSYYISLLTLGYYYLISILKHILVNYQFLVNALMDSFSLSCHFEY